MSFIVKGIDMPKDAEYFSIVFYKKKSYRKEKIMDISEAIQIPTPHGRFGDLDKVLKGLEADTREAFTRHDVWLMLSKYNTNAPTILEAEE